MDIVFWPHTTNENVASFRLRCLQIVENLQAQGVDVSFYHSQVKPKILVLSKRYDKQSLASGLKLRSLYGTKLVLDLCDNHFYYDNNPNIWDGRAKQLYDAILAVDLLICSSENLAKTVFEEVGENVKIKVIGDAAEMPLIPAFSNKILHPFSELLLNLYKKKLSSLGIQEGRKLIWFGNHGSNNAAGGMEDILLIKDELFAHHLETPISLTIVSNNKKKYKHIAKNIRVPSLYVEWNKGTFSRVLKCNDIALIPVNNNPFNDCKTNNRLATATVHGLAVAATSIPSYEEFSGAVELNNWDNGLRNLMADHQGRELKKQHAMALIEQKYSLAEIVSLWRQCLESL